MNGTYFILTPNLKRLLEITLKQESWMFIFLLHKDNRNKTSHEIPLFSKITYYKSTGMKFTIYYNHPKIVICIVCGKPAHYLR